MPAVEGSRGAEDGELEAGDTPLAEDELSAPTGMHGSVAEEPRVTRQRRPVRLEDLSQVAGAGFFLPLEEDLQVYRLLNMVLAHRVDRGEDSHNRCLVVARRSRVETRLGVDARSGICGKRNLLAAIVQRTVAQHGRPRR